MRFLSRFLADVRGASAVTFALSSIVMLGAAGLALDMANVQNSQAALQRVADSTCQEIQSASLANYPASDDVVAMATAFGNGEFNQNAASNGRVSGSTVVKKPAADQKAPPQNVAVTTEGAAAISVQFNGASTANGVTTESYNVTVNQTVASFIKTMGYGGSQLSASMTCTRANSGSTGECDSGDFLLDQAFTPSTGPSFSASYLLEKAASNNQTGKYVATILDNKTSAILSQAQFSGAYTYSAPSHTTSVMSIVIQQMNLDGSQPPFCTGPAKYTPPSPKCSITDAETTANGYTKDPEKDKITIDEFDDTAHLSMSPQAAQSVKPGSIKVYGPAGKHSHTLLGPPNYSATVKLSDQFWANTKTHQTVVDKKGNRYDVTPELAYLFRGATGRLTFTAAEDSVDSGIADYITKSERYTDASQSGFNGAWLLVHVFNSSNAIWQDATTHLCFEIQSPIALDLTGLGHIAVTGMSTSPEVARTEMGRTVRIPTGDGGAVDIEWLVGEGQGLLVDNRDGKAATDMSLARLFGAEGSAANGYEKLRRLDHSGTGVLRGADLDGLAVWLTNGDGVAKPSEIVSLRDLGVSEISTRMSWKRDGSGHRVMRSHAVVRGKTIMTEDVWLGVGR